MKEKLVIHVKDILNFRSINVDLDYATKGEFLFEGLLPLKGQKQIK